MDPGFPLQRPLELLQEHSTPQNVEFRKTSDIQGRAGCRISPIVLFLITSSNPVQHHK